MSNAALAQQFDKAADVLAIKNANTFRVLAFRKIARALEELPSDVGHLSVEDLEAVPGIGKSSAEKIREFLRTGKIGEFEDLFADVPHGVMEIMNLPGVGPKTAALLWTEGQITAPQQLLTMIESKSVPEIRGIGEKKLEKIRQSILHQATTLGRVRLSRALPIATELVAFIKTLRGVADAQYCGSLRRGKETIGDIDIAVSAPPEAAGAIGAAITKHPLTTEVLAAGETKTSIRTLDGLQVDVRIVPPESFGAALQYFTGSKEHNTKLREIAVKTEFKLNEWGLFKGDAAVAGKTENEIYAALGMLTVPPEMREDKGEIQLAIERGAKGQKAFDAEVLQITDIRSELHMHTTASDGTLSIAEMVAECKRRGFTHCAITDHSKSQVIANGLKTDRMIQHIQAIRAVAKEVKGIHVLAGAEVDILADGSMDYEDDLLLQLDWVVGSPHAALTQESEEATARLVRAASNPLVHVIGHPTGRLVGKRRGLEPDMQKVIFAAARSGIALEVNASASRLDLRDVHVRMAIDAGVPITIDTDAHGAEDFNQLVFGILTARRGWAMKANVINTWPWEKFEKWRKGRREGAEF